MLGYNKCCTVFPSIQHELIQTWIASAQSQSTKTCHAGLTDNTSLQGRLLVLNARQISYQLSCVVTRLVMSKLYQSLSVCSTKEHAKLIEDI